MYTNAIIARITALKKAFERVTTSHIDISLQFECLQKDIDMIDDPCIRETLQRSLDSMNLYNNRQPAEMRIAYLEKNWNGFARRKTIRKMIELRYWKDEKLKKWYAKQILKQFRKKSADKKKY